MQHCRSPVEIVSLSLTKQSRSTKIYGNPGRCSPRHRSAHQWNRLMEPLQAFDYHHRGGHGDQHTVDQGRELSTTPKPIGEALAGGSRAEPLSPPAKGQTHHIAEVMDGITDQGQGSKPNPNRELHSRQGTVENNAAPIGAGEGGSADVLLGMGSALVARGHD